jgi:hypothetical protein
MTLHERAKKWAIEHARCESDYREICEEGYELAIQAYLAGYEDPER